MLSATRSVTPARKKIVSTSWGPIRESYFTTVQEIVRLFDTSDKIRARRSSSIKVTEAVRDQILFKRLCARSANSFPRENSPRRKSREKIHISRSLIPLVLSQTAAPRFIGVASGGYQAKGQEVEMGQSVCPHTLAETEPHGDATQSSAFHPCHSGSLAPSKFKT